MRRARIGRAVLLAMCSTLGCGDDDASARADAGPAPEVDQGAPLDAGRADASLDAALPNTCLAPERQSLPCCWERSNAEHAETELIVRSMRFHAPEAAANVLFDGQIQNAFDDGRVPWLIDVRSDASGTVARTGFGVYDAERGTYAYSIDDAPPPGEPTRRRPVELVATIDDDHFETESATGILVIPAIGGAAADLPQPELVFRRLRFLDAPLTDERTCIGARTASRRWSYGDPPSRVEAYMTVEDAAVTDIQALGMSFCSFLAGRSCDEPRETWATPPDARCEDDGTCGAAEGSCVRDSDDPATGCNAWRFEISFAAAGVEIE